MSETVQANDGAMLPLDSLPQNFEFDGNFVANISVEYAGSTYVQTFVNDGVNIIFISGWLNTTYPVINEIMITEGGDEMVTETNSVMITENAA